MCLLFFFCYSLTFWLFFSFATFAAIKLKQLKCFSFGICVDSHQNELKSVFITHTDINTQAHMNWVRYISIIYENKQQFFFFFCSLHPPYTLMSISRSRESSIFLNKQFFLSSIRFIFFFHFVRCVIFFFMYILKFQAHERRLKERKRICI